MLQVQIIPVCLSTLVAWFCDSIHDSCLLLPQEAIALARTKRVPEAAAQTLIQAAFSRGSADNITCIVVRFHDGNLDANFTTFGKA